MVLNFTFNEWGSICSQNEDQRKNCIKSIAIHEFGHALGIAHEHNREDTPNSCNDAPQGTNGDVTVGEWDLSSVMNYCNPDLINMIELSDGDIDTINAAYRSLIRSSNIPPSKPINVAVDLTRNGKKVRVNWRAGDQNQTGFEVQRSNRRNNGEWKQPVLINTVNGGVTVHKDSPGQGQFRYRVRATNQTGRSRWSSWKRIRIQ